MRLVVGLGKFNESVKIMSTGHEVIIEPISGDVSHISPKTPFAIDCYGDCGKVYLSEEEYDRQMMAVDSTWKCPICRCEAYFDDDNFEDNAESWYDRKTGNVVDVIEEDLEA